MRTPTTECRPEAPSVAVGHLSELTPQADAKALTPKNEVLAQQPNCSKYYYGNLCNMAVICHTNLKKDILCSSRFSSTPTASPSLKRLCFLPRELRKVLPELSFLAVPQASPHERGPIGQVVHACKKTYSLHSISAVIWALNTTIHINSRGTCGGSLCKSAWKCEGKADISIWVYSTSCKIKTRILKRNH